MKWLLIALLCLVCTAAGYPQLPAQQIQINQQNRTIAVSTSDQATGLADTAQIQVGFQSYGKEQEALYAEAAATSNAIVGALKAAGVPESSIESTGQNLRPLSVNGEDDRTRYADGLRFTFSQSWRVTAPAEAAAHILQVAIAAGANNSGEIAWSLKDDQALVAQAAARALMHARQIAATMAEGLGAKLGELIYAGNQAPPEGLSPTAVPGFARGFAGNLGGGVMQLKSAPLAIAPERITRDATIYAVFAIQ